MAPIRIGFFVYPEFSALDLFGPYEAFALAVMPDGSQAYEPVIFSAGLNPIRSESGVYVQPKETTQSLGPVDTILVPGGKGLRVTSTQQLVSSWLAHHAPGTRRVATVCTGIYGLAPTGLLDGRRVTTHWAHAADFSKLFPNLTVVEDQLFIQDGPYFTSAGITAGIDLALAMIEQDFGHQCSLAVARELVVYVRRAGNQSQFSEFLKVQAQAEGPCQGIVDWILANLKSDLTLESIAQHASLSSRQISRLFIENFRLSPVKFVEHMRLDEARAMLANYGASINLISASVGFKNPDSFRRSFSRKYGISPSLYRSVLVNKYVNRQFQPIISPNKTI